MPIYRVREILQKGKVLCECWDIESQRFLTYTLDIAHIMSDEPSEAMRAMLAPSTYTPTSEELRWWIQQNKDKLGNEE